MECDVCGSRNVSRHDVEGVLLEECNLCGNLQGDDEAVSHIENLRNGRARGLDDEIIPLVAVLEVVHAIRIVHASAGIPDQGEPPHVFFALVKNDTRPIERILKSVELANRETKLRWVLELSLQHEIVYMLRPRFLKPPRDITRAEIREARKDLPLLARRLKRDQSLSWWRD